MKYSTVFKFGMVLVTSTFLSVSYAGKPDHYTGSGDDTWTTSGGSGEHGGLTPSGNTHQGVRSGRWL